MSPANEIFDWQGITLSVAYTADLFGMRHIELRVVSPEGAILPVTETGYRSHFFREDVEEWGGPVGYVRAWLDFRASSAEWKRREAEAKQLRLF